MAWEDAGRIAFQNMLLLGFDTDEAEKRHGVAITEQTFLQQQMAGSGLGPHKPMEVVMHFLLLKGLPSDAQAPLKLLFPVVEKQQARDFRKFATDSLGGLQKTKELPPTPLIRSTIFDSPCGPKFCQMLLHFSQYVMRRQMLAMKKSAALVMPTFQRQNARSLVRVARQRVAHERHLFLDHIRRAGNAHDHWTQFAHDFLEAYETAVRSRAEVAAARQELLSTVDSELCLDHGSAEAKAEEYDERVQSMWSTIELSRVGSHAQRESVERLLVNDGHEKSINIAGLMQQTSQDLNPSAPILKENLDMEALLQRWAANIGQIHRQLLQNTAGRAGLDRMAASAPDVKALADEAHSRFITAQSLRVQLAADVETARRSIKELRTNVEHRYEGSVMNHDASMEEAASLSPSSSPNARDGRVPHSPQRQDWHDEHNSSRVLEYHHAALSGNGSPNPRDSESLPTSPPSHDLKAASAAATQEHPTTQLQLRASPVNGIAVYGTGVVDASTHAGITELDERMKRLKKQLSSPPHPRREIFSNAQHGPNSGATPSDSQSAYLKRPAAAAPSPLSQVNINYGNGPMKPSPVKPSPPATPPPLVAALRGKRLVNGDATQSPPSTKTVLEMREVVVGKEAAACDPQQSEIERRRASLRSKLAGALDDDILSPPLVLGIAGGSGGAFAGLEDMLAGDLKQTISPPKIAGKGEVVLDDTSGGRYFDE